ncbi:MAG: VOC family protein [Lachnospiraceae bacterium]
MKKQEKGKQELAFHHICITASDYKKAVEFYVDYLGLKVYGESYSYNRNARKLELYCRGEYVIELFVKDKTKEIAEKERGGDGRSHEESRAGLDHAAFLTADVEAMLTYLKERGVPVSRVKKDLRTGREYGFCQDPDGTMIEFYQE